MVPICQNVSVLSTIRRCRPSAPKCRRCTVATQLYRWPCSSDDHRRRLGSVRCVKQMYVSVRLFASAHYACRSSAKTPQGVVLPGTRKLLSLRRMPHPGPPFRRCPHFGCGLRAWCRLKVETDQIRRESRLEGFEVLWTQSVSAPQLCVSFLPVVEKIAVCS